MQGTTPVSTRRGLLQRGLVLLGGALGIGAASGVGTAGAVPAPPSRELTLYGRGFHQHSPARRPGEVPRKGDRATTYGELLDRAGGAKIGEFTAAFLALGSPFGASSFAAASLEVHSFYLKDGTILGLGSAATAWEGAFAVVGGTGSYAGARGSYLARQRPRELGGDGTAEFHLTLTLAA
jgi:hypothetical protein